VYKNKLLKRKLKWQKMKFILKLNKFNFRRTTNDRI
jgi:hypothetical protein